MAKKNGSGGSSGGVVGSVMAALLFFGLLAMTSGEEDFSVKAALKEVFGMSEATVTEIFEKFNLDSLGNAVSGDVKESKKNTPSLSAASAKRDLDALETKGKASTSGYDRTANYGPSWPDLNGNGCDERNEILKRDLTGVKYKDGKRCAVASGNLADPYTGKSIDFVSGAKTSGAVQIDHVVALSNSWATGAQAWPQSKREKFANDPLNLLAVDGPSNSAKKDSDASAWLPPNKSYRCEYVSRQIEVKKKYGLYVTKSEKAAMKAILDKC